MNKAGTRNESRIFEELDDALSCNLSHLYGIITILKKMNKPPLISSFAYKYIIFIAQPSATFLQFYFMQLVLSSYIYLRDFHTVTKLGIKFIIYLKI